MKKLFKEFKEFAVKGNMIDMAIGIIIGAAFNKVINVLVYDIILPPLSLLTKGISYVDRKIVLEPEIKDAAGVVIQNEAAIKYGSLIEVALDFLIVGFTIFLAVKAMNRLKKKSEDAKDVTIVTPKDIELLTDLKSLMEDQNKLLSDNLKK
ncbi:MAG: large conductance mechanosensitive channel protein MscL [Bacteroidota bacterium]